MALTIGHPAPLIRRGAAPGWECWGLLQHPCSVCYDGTDEGAPGRAGTDAFLIKKGQEGQGQLVLKPSVNIVHTVV